MNKQIIILKLTVDQAQFVRVAIQDKIEQDYNLAVEKKSLYDTYTQREEMYRRIREQIPNGI